MSEQHYDPIIPIHSKGKSLDIEQYLTDNSLEAALKTFERAKYRLLNPNIWNSLSGSFSANFQLFGSDNIALQRLAEIGDYCRIDIVGPGSTSGEGYDWVKISSIQENGVKEVNESVAIVLITTSHPTNDVKETAHFFDENASSTFIIKRKGSKVSASYHGRNEVPNVKQVPMVDKMRNLLVATGAEAGLSKFQWNALLEGFLQPEIGGQAISTSPNDAIF